MSPQTRFALSPTKTPALTGGDDRPVPACVGNSTPFDLLHDYISGPTHERAKRAAAALCAECPIKAACWTENAETAWVKALRLGPRPLPVEGCGTPEGVNRHRRKQERLCELCAAADSARRKVSGRWARASAAREASLSRRNEARAAELRHLHDMGATMRETCAAMDLTRDALAKWCGRHQMMDIYRAILDRSADKAVA